MHYLPSIVSCFILWLDNSWFLLERSYAFSPGAKCHLLVLRNIGDQFPVLFILSTFTDSFWVNHAFVFPNTLVKKRFLFVPSSNWACAYGSCYVLQVHGCYGDFFLFVNFILHSFLLFITLASSSLHLFLVLFSDSTIGLYCSFFSSVHIFGEFKFTSISCFVL